MDKVMVTKSFMPYLDEYVEEIKDLWEHISLPIWE